MFIHCHPSSFFKKGLQKWRKMGLWAFQYFISLLTNGGMRSTCLNVTFSCKTWRTYRKLVSGHTWRWRTLSELGDIYFMSLISFYSLGLVFSFTTGFSIGKRGPWFHVVLSLGNQSWLRVRRPSNFQSLHWGLTLGQTWWVFHIHHFV